MAKPLVPLRRDLDVCIVGSRVIADNASEAVGLDLIFKFPKCVTGKVPSCK